MGFFKKLEKGFLKIFEGLTYGAGAIAFLMMVLSVANVCTRTFFTAPIFGTVEVITYAGLAMGALALAQNEMDEGNPVMTLLVDSFRPKARATIMALAQALCVVFYAVCTVRFCKDIFTTIAQNKLTSTLEWPLWIFYAFMFVGFFFLTFASLIKCIRNVGVIFKKKTDEEGEQA